MTEKVTRRDFLTGATAATATTLAAPAIALGKSKFKWKMATTWPPGLPILQDAADRFANERAN